MPHLLMILRTCAAVALVIILETMFAALPTEARCRGPLSSEACDDGGVVPAAVVAPDARQTGGTQPTKHAAVVQSRFCGGSAQDVNATPQPRSTIQGHVFDDARRPVRAASVSVQKVEFAGGMKNERTVLTDEKGEYRVDDVPPGQYYVSAVVNTPGSFTPNPRDRAPQPRKVGFGPTFYPGTTWFAYAHRVSVYAGDQVAGIDITLEKKRLARLSGKLVSSRHALKDGAHVALAPAASIGRAGLKGFLGVSQVTADGEFVIDAFPPGEYVLQGLSIPLRAVEEIALTGRSAPLTADADAEFGSMPLTVDGTDVTNLQLMLARGGRIRGRVTIDERAFRPAGVRVAIRAEPTGSQSLSIGVNDARIGTDGGFEIGGVTGEFVLRLSGDVSGISLKRVQVDGRDVTDTGVFVNPGEDAGTVDVILTSHSSVVTGRIIAGDRGAHSRCQVIAFSQEPERWSWAATRYVGVGQVGADATFRLEGLPQGKYFAIAVTQVEDGQWLDPDYLRTLVRQAKTFELREGERKALNLPLKSK